MNEFETKCRNKVYTVLTAWADNISVQHVDSNVYRGEYRLTARHSFGTAYCDWTNYKDKIIEALKAAGATYIRCKVRYNYVEAYFNERKRKKK